MHNQDVWSSTVPLSYHLHSPKLSPRGSEKLKELGGRLLKAHQVPLPHLTDRDHKVQGGETADSMSPSRWMSEVKLRQSWVSEFLPQVTWEIWRWGGYFTVELRVERNRGSKGNEGNVRTEAKDPPRLEMSRRFPWLPQKGEFFL